MNRRDFLLFRTEHKMQLVELSCERLYMRYLDSQAAGATREERRALEPWEGEPPSELVIQTTRELFDDLGRQLQTCDAVRVVDTDWLAADEFKRELELVIAAFRDRGGRVEFGRRLPV